MRLATAGRAAARDTRPARHAGGGPAPSRAPSRTRPSLLSRATTVGALALLLLRPATSRATAGFAETNSRLEYGSLAMLDWLHPADGCDCGNFCFHILKRQHPYGFFRDLSCSLGKINAPPSEHPSLILAQCCGNGQWLVYDLQAEKYLTRTNSYADALAAWKANGLAEPRFADAGEGARGLSETWSSRRERWTWMALLWLPVLAVLLLPLCGIACVVYLVKFIRTRRKRNIALALLFFLPSLPAWWLVFRVVSRMMVR